MKKKKQKKKKEKKKEKKNDNSTNKKQMMYSRKGTSSDVVSIGVSKTIVLNFPTGHDEIDLWPRQDSFLPFANRSVGKK